jgi:hypothetical protein
MFGFFNNFFGNQHQDVNFQDNNIGFVEIQIQKGVEHWRTYTTTNDDPGYISMVMMEVSQMNPEYRVRAIDNSGRLLDML